MALLSVEHDGAQVVLIVIDSSVHDMDIPSTPQGDAWQARRDRDRAIAMAADAGLRCGHWTPQQDRNPKSGLSQL